jgi:hypothetical protein
VARRTGVDLAVLGARATILTTLILRIDPAQNYGTLSPREIDLSLDHKCRVRTYRIVSICRAYAEHEGQTYGNGGGSASLQATQIRPIVSRRPPWRSADRG